MGVKREVRKFLVAFGISLFNYSLKLNKMFLKFNPTVEYELFDFYKKTFNTEIFIPKVKTIEETIEEIVKNKKSICRYGDGEFRIALEDNIGFQKYNEKLAARLREILISDNDNILIGIWDFFGSLENYSNYAKKIARAYMKELRQPIYSLLDKNKIYWNAFITRFYLCTSDMHITSKYFVALKKIWDNQDTVIIEGEFTKFAYDNDLMDNAKSIQRVLCPVKNAYDHYDEILDFAKTLPKNKLILIALGPCATVLAYDLAMEGYWAVDIGHADIEYEWFKIKAKKPVPIKNKYSNDANEKNGGVNINVKESESFIKQVIGRIKG